MTCYMLLISFLVCSDLFGFAAQPIIARLTHHVTQQLYIRGTDGDKTTCWRLRSASHRGRGRGRTCPGDSERGHTASLDSVSLNFPSTLIVPRKSPYTKVSTTMAALKFALIFLIFIF